MDHGVLSVWQTCKRDTVRCVQSVEQTDEPLTMKHYIVLTSNVHDAFVGFVCVCVCVCIFVYLFAVCFLCVFFHTFVLFSTIEHV